MRRRKWRHLTTKHWSYRRTSQLPSRLSTSSLITSSLTRTLDDFETFSFLSIALPSVVQSTYSSALNMSSETYSREKCGVAKHYYQALQINISVSGDYGFSSDSRMDIYGSLYRDRFDPLDPSHNRIPDDDDGCGKGQFWLHRSLQTNTAYILVVATSVSDAKDAAFNITATGIASVSFSRLGESAAFRVLIADSIAVPDKYDLKQSLEPPTSRSSLDRSR